MKKFHKNLVSIPQLAVEQTDDGKRWYITPEGNKYPSITTVLSHSSKKVIENWKKRVGEEESNRIATTAANSGKLLHKICENYMNGIESPTKGFMPTTIQMFKQIVPFIDKIDNISGIEISMYSNEYGIAGSSDLIAEYDGVRAIIDFKTINMTDPYRGGLHPSKKHKYMIQTNAYRHMFRERTGMEVTRGIIMVASNFTNPELVIDDDLDKYNDELKTLISKYKESENEIT